MPRHPDAVVALPTDVSVLLTDHDIHLMFCFAKRISALVDGGLLVEGAGNHHLRAARA
ncbi:MAG: hypothetical protein JSR91_14990 [Proteobacteria bacterium]|nr:hypothetical protein [Pseudomonadota bacterium]